MDFTWESDTESWNLCSTKSASNHDIISIFGLKKPWRFTYDATTESDFITYKDQNSITDAGTLSYLMFAYVIRIYS